MKRILARWVPALFFMFAVNSLQLACSSSEEAATGEEVAASEGGNENAADPNEEGQGAENESGDNVANAEAGNNNVGLNQESESNLAATEEPAAASGGEEDLQQIIEEMNGTNGAQTANQEGVQGADNVGATNAAVAASNEAPVENLAGDTAVAPGASSSPSAGAGSAAVGMPAGPGLPELGSKMSYIVQKGDTLAKISQRVYGDSNKWTEIANFTGLANPKLIYPGDVVYYQLTEQSMTFAGTYEGMKRNQVQVSQGDTLATIAGRVLGNSTLWKLIWRQNDRIDNPDRLTAGTTIYYVDPAQVASIDSIVPEKIASKAVKTQELQKSTEKVGKIVKTVVFEVANDHMDDQFRPSNGTDFLQRSLI